MFNRSSIKYTTGDLGKIFVGAEDMRDKEVRTSVVQEAWLQGTEKTRSESQGAIMSFDGCCRLSLCWLVFTMEEPLVGL